jgi:predicted acetyltransferase
MAQFFLEWEKFQAKVVEKTTTHIFFFESRTVYDIIVEPDKSQVITWFKRIAYWIPKVTNTHIE